MHDGSYYNMGKSLFGMLPPHAPVQCQVRISHKATIVTIIHLVSVFLSLNTSSPLN